MPDITPNDLMEVFEAVADAIANETGEEARAREYSGRAMYGKYVPAIVTDADGTTVGTTFSEVARRDFDWTDADVRKHTPSRTDSMGLSTVYY